MTKDTHWFKHDYNARRDPKIIRLCRIKGIKGYGIYWSLIEILHEQGGEISSQELNDIAFELREDEGNLLSVIKEFGLFEISNTDVSNSYYISNKRVLQSIAERTKKSTNSRNAVLKRWGAESTDSQVVDTGVLPKQYNSSSRREEEIREEEINSVLLFLNQTCGTDYKLKSKSHREFINARIKEGFAPPDFELVIKQKFNQWGNDSKMKRYLRPSTLFNSEKFDGYVQEAKEATPKTSIKTHGTGWND